MSCQVERHVLGYFGFRQPFLKHPVSFCIARENLEHITLLKIISFNINRCPKVLQQFYYHTAIIRTAETCKSQRISIDYHFREVTKMTNVWRTILWSSSFLEELKTPA